MTTSSFRKLQLTRLLTENIFVMLLQYMGITFCMLGPEPTPVNFAAGTMVAFIFMRGESVLPGIWLGSFIAFYMASHSLFIATLAAAIISFEGWFLLRLLYLVGIPTILFHDRKSWLIFITISATLAAGTHIIFPIGNQTWLANWLGILIVASGIITWDMYFPEMSDRKKLLSLSHWYGKIGLLFLLAFIVNLVTTRHIELSQYILLAGVILSGYAETRASD